MDNKPNWIQAVKETISIPTIIAFVCGVPAMIAFIATIWHSLSLHQQIIACALAAIIILAIVIFIWEQTRKILYHIPPILYQRHLRLMKISQNLKLSQIGKNEITDFISLVNIDATTLFSKYKDLESFSIDIPQLIKMTKEKTSEVLENKEASQRPYYFMFDKIGLKQLLEKDSTYSKLGKRLENLMPRVPTEEIVKSISEYEKSSRVYGTFIPFTKSEEEQITQLFPLSFVIDGIVKKESSEEEMKRLLAKVWESINKHYQKN